MDLVLIRHPRVDAKGICYGRSDVPLAAGYEAEIANAVGILDRPSSIHSSPSSRCAVLAKSIADTFDHVVTYNPDFLELDFGNWEGERWDQIKRAESDPWAEDPLNFAPPNGETFRALMDRTIRAADKLENALVVTHAGPIRALLMHHNGLSFDEAFARDIPYATPISVQT